MFIINLFRRFLDWLELRLSPPPPKSLLELAIGEVSEYADHIKADLVEKHGEKEARTHTILIDNQLSYVANTMLSNSNDFERDIPVSKAMIDLVVTVLNKIITPHLVSFQAMTKPVDQGFQLRYTPTRDAEIQTESQFSGATVGGSSITVPPQPTTKAFFRRQWGLEVVSIALEAASRKLETAFSLVPSEPDGEVHYDRMVSLAQDIADEIDAEIVSDMFAVSATKVDSISNTQFALQTARSKIADTSARGIGNVIVCSKDSLSLISDNDPTWKPTEIDLVPFAGSFLAGTLDNGIVKVFVLSDNAWSRCEFNEITTEENDDGEEVEIKTPIDQKTKNVFVVGYKGTSALDSGLVYAPYIMLMTGGCVMNPVTFKPRMGFFSRYGKYIHASETSPSNGKNYYGAVICDKESESV